MPAVSTLCRSLSRVAAAQVRHRLPVPLLLLPLRPEDQEIHDRENQDERQELDQHVRSAGGAGLCKGR